MTATKRLAIRRSIARLIVDADRRGDVAIRMQHYWQWCELAPAKWTRGMLFADLWPRIVAEAANA